MILTIDIGNSHMTVGGYTNDLCEFVFDLVSDVRRTKDQYMAELKSLMDLHHIDLYSLTGGIIGSVVPELTYVIFDAVKQLCGIEPLVVGPGIKSGLNIRIENPAQLGADIFAGAVAALEKYEPPCIICNLGTATVMSVIDAAGLFCGVIIAAGVGTTLDGFTKRTALLPHVNIDPPKKIIGKNSVQSVQSGLVYGTAAMIDGLVTRIEREIGAKARVIANGNICDTIIPHCDTEIEIYKNLILDGLRMIYEKNS